MPLLPAQVPQFCSIASPMGGHNVGEELCSAMSRSLPARGRTWQGSDRPVSASL